MTVTPDRDLISAARDRLAAGDRAVDRLLSRLLRRSVITSGDERQLAELQQALDVARPEHMTHARLRLLERYQLSLRAGLSFRSIMVEQSEAWRIGAFRPGWLLDRKDTAYPLVDRLRVRRPKLYQGASPLARIKPRSPAVLKLTRGTGSRGVYLIYSGSHIRHVNTKDPAEFSSWSGMVAHAAKLMTDGPRREPDEWMLEELILEDPAEGLAARNLKFYAFYGETLFVQESRREPDLEVAFWSRDGEPISTGRYNEHRFDGIGATAEQVRLAERISAEIPTPFMRIDMLTSPAGLVFGEFTPRPGRFQQFSPEWDRRMGEAWVRAEGRLVADVLDGKRFKPFAKATAERRRRAR